MKNDSKLALLLPSPPLWGRLPPSDLLPGNSPDSIAPKRRELLSAVLRYRPTPNKHYISFCLIILLLVTRLPRAKALQRALMQNVFLLLNEYYELQRGRLSGALFVQPLTSK